jgi:hypothetical protein
MTNREAYVFGWVFGRLSAEAFPEDIGGDVVLAAPRPYTANARVISDAHRIGILKGDLEQQVGEALFEIDSIVAPMEGSSEKYQPLEIQGSWQLGYFVGKGKRPLPTAKVDIAAARRAQKMTQGQLAEAIGVDQALISRWESGKVVPNKESMAKLRNVLSIG